MDCEDRDVVFLTEVAGSLRDGFGREARGEQGPCPVEAVELAFFAAGFGDAIGVEGEAVAIPEDQFLILELGFRGEATG